MKASSNKIFIGTMSGTSHDGIDVCAIETSNQINLLKFDSFKYPKKLRANISNVIQQQHLSLDEYFKLNEELSLIHI